MLGLLQKDAKTGDTHLRQFQDNEKTLPTILTTSQKLSTGVDALKYKKYCFNETSK